jgi:nucleotide-binding universal stress UspA family protein
MHHEGVDVTREGSRAVVAAGVDGSDAALAATRFALEEARWRSASLHLVTAVPLPHNGLTALPLEMDLLALLRESGQSIAQRATDALAGTVDGVDVHRFVVDGHPVDVLRAMSERAQLIVLGSRGLGGVGGLLLGSTANRIVSYAHCPVIVLPDDSDLHVSERRSVVVGVVGGQNDEEVLAFAFSEAAARGTDLVAVHAWQDVVVDAPLRRSMPDWAHVVAHEERVLIEALAGWKEREPEFAVREVVVRDRAARALVAASMTAELLVVGHRAGRVPGATTHGVLHRATCPVAVVPITTGSS